MKTRHRIGGLAAAALAACLAPSTYAQDTHFKIYGGPAYVAPMSDSTITVGSITDTVKSEKQVGWNLGFEGRFGKLLGLEVDYVNANQDVSFGGSTIGDTTFSPLTATLDFHILHTTIVDLYLGPSYSYVNWGDIHVNSNGASITGGSDIGTDSAHGWGASLGLDIGLGKHFAITGGLKYLDVALKTANGQTADVNPLVARLGAAFRF
jgi:outer membrane protein W